MAGPSGLGNEWVYDELLCFVGSPLFQIPVASFMESNCLIFDPSLEDCREYREVHAAYRELVTALLDAFRQDTNLTHDQIIQAMTEMSEKEDLREIFQELFKQILATESLGIFVRVMTEKNIELQQQALFLLLHRLGHTPESLKMADRSPKSAEGGQQQQPSHFIATVIASSSPAAHEEAVFQNVIRSATATGSSRDSAQAADVDDSIVVAMSHEAVAQLEAEKMKEQQRLTEAVKRMTLSEEDESYDLGLMESKAIPRISKESRVVAGTAGGSALPQGGKAAGGPTAAVTAEEVGKRQEFLRQQKEKLMALKRKEREKQLDTYEQSEPTSRLRPQSSRAARSAMSSGSATTAPATSRGAGAPAAATPASKAETGAAQGGGGGDDDEQKKLAMRRAIASRLRAEMLGK